VNSQSYWRKKC